MKWQEASDIKKEIKELVHYLSFTYVNLSRIICFRSFGSTSRARARIWSLPRVWQMALQTSPAYVIEVISEKFDKLSLGERKKILIHELLHIPKNFSGSLLPHRGRGREIDYRVVEKLFRQFQEKVKK